MFLQKYNNAQEIKVTGVIYPFVYKFKSIYKKTMIQV